MAKSVTDVALANIRAKIAALQIAEEALIEASALEAVPEVPKAKRGRGKGKAKPGLPAAEDEATRMAV